MKEVSKYLLETGKYDEYKRLKKLRVAYKFCEYLDKKGIYYDKCIKHKLVLGCDDSSEYYKRFSDYLCDDYIICKNLLVQERKGEKRKFLIITDAKKKINLSELKEQIDSKKLEFVSSEDMKELLNTTPGNVSLFNMIYDKSESVNVIIDDELLSAKELAFHPLYNEMSVFLKPSECLKFLKVINRDATFIPIKEKIEEPIKKVLVS